MYCICANRAVSVPLFGQAGVKIMYCANRVVLVPLFGQGRQIYCANRAILPMARHFWYGIPFREKVWYGIPFRKKQLFPRRVFP